MRNAIIGTCALMFPNLLKILKIKTTDPQVEEFILSVVKQNLHYRESNNVIRKDFFQLLVQLRNNGNVHLDDEWDTKIIDNEADKKMSINEVSAQSFVFFAAGFETSSSTMSYCLYELAKNPVCMKKVQDEIDEVIKKHNGKITFDAVNEMKYLDYCIDGICSIYKNNKKKLPSKINLIFFRNITHVPTVTTIKS